MRLSWQWQRFASTMFLSAVRMRVMAQRYLLACGVAIVCVATFVLAERVLAQTRISNDFLITDVRVFDGTRTLQRVDVAVAGGIIRAVGVNLASVQKLPTIDGAGMTLVPGLIEAHAHVVSAGELRQALRFGVTTVLDMGTVSVPERDVFSLREVAIAASDMADMRSAGFPATAPNAHGTEFTAVFPTVATVSEAKEFVAGRRAEGSNYLKVILNGVRSAATGVPNLDEPRVKALVNAAHAANMLAVAHVESLDDVTVALSAGVDGLAHVWRRGGPSADMARQLAARGVFVTATLAVPDARLPEGRAALLADPRFRGVLSIPIREHLSRSVPSPTPGADGPRANADAQIASVRSLHEAGVTLLVGTDASLNTPSAHGISVHYEIELFTKAGLSPSEILAAATANSADAFHLDDRGKILSGRRADLVLVRGDPTSDVLAIRDIVRIWKSGVELDRTATER